MATDDTIKFTLSDSTHVIVKKLLGNKYDFELLLPTGNRKTFLWFINAENKLDDRKGNIDPIILEAIEQFKQLTG